MTVARPSGPDRSARPERLGRVLRRAAAAAGLGMVVATAWAVLLVSGLAGPDHEGLWAEVVWESIVWGLLLWLWPPALVVGAAVGVVVWLLVRSAGRWSRTAALVVGAVVTGWAPIGWAFGLGAGAVGLLGAHLELGCQRRYRPIGDVGPA
jgi:hypothetical protein